MSMTGLVLGFCCLLVVQADPYHKYCKYDILEVNHVHDQWGFPIFVQLIAWDWDRHTKRHHVQAWRILRDGYELDNKEHREAFEKHVEQVKSKYNSMGMRQRVANSVKYRGKYVGGHDYPRRQLGGLFVARWTDDGVTRVALAEALLERHTQHDPELEDRHEWPETARRGWNCAGKAVTQ